MYAHGDWDLRESHEKLTKSQKLTLWKSWEREAPM